MQLNDKKEFFKILRSLFNLYGKDPEPNIYALWFDLFQEYDFKEVNQAVTLYAKNEKYPPVPAGVIDYMPKEKQISADEAWAHIPKSENDGVYMTQRMANALGQVSGMDDRVAMRMSFKAAYDNLPNDNKWFYSHANGVNYEQQEEMKTHARQNIEDKKWISEKKRKNTPLIEHGLSKMQIESNKTRVIKLLSTTLKVMDTEDQTACIQKTSNKQN